MISIHKYLFLEGKIWMARFIFLLIALLFLLTFPLSLSLVENQVITSTINEISDSKDPDIYYYFSHQHEINQLLYNSNFQQLFDDKVQKLHFDLDYDFFISKLGISVNLIKNNDEIDGYLWFISDIFFENYLYKVLSNNSSVPTNSTDAIILLNNISSFPIAMNDNINVKLPITNRLLSNFTIKNFINTSKFPRPSPVEFEILRGLTSGIHLFVKDSHKSSIINLDDTDLVNTVGEFFVNFNRNSMRKDLDYQLSNLKNIVTSINSTLVLLNWKNIELEAPIINILENGVNNLIGATDILLLIELPGLMLAIICYLSSSLILRKKSFLNTSLSLERGITFKQIFIKIVIEDIIIVLTTFIAGIFCSFISINILLEILKATLLIQVEYNVFFQDMNFLLLILFIHLSFIICFDFHRHIRIFKTFFTNSQWIKLENNSKGKEILNEINNFSFFLGISIILTFFVFQSVGIFTSQELEKFKGVTLTGFMLICISFPLFSLTIIHKGLKIIEKLLALSSGIISSLILYSFRAFKTTKMITTLIIFILSSTFFSSLFIMHSINFTYISEEEFKVGGKTIINNIHSSDIEGIKNFIMENESFNNIKEFSVVNFWFPITNEINRKYRFFGIEEISNFLENAYFPSYIDLSVDLDEFIDNLNNNSIFIQEDDMNDLILQSESTINLNFQNLNDNHITLKEFNVGGTFKRWPNFYPNLKTTDNLDAIDIVCSSTIINEIVYNLTASNQFLYHSIYLTFSQEKSPSKAEIDQINTKLLKMTLEEKLFSTIYVLESLSHNIEDYLPIEIFITWQILNYYYLLNCLIMLLVIPLSLSYFSTKEVIDFHTGIYKTIGLNSTSYYQSKIIEGSILNCLTVFLGTLSGYFISMLLMILTLFDSISKIIPLQFKLPFSDYLIFILVIFLYELVFYLVSAYFKFKNDIRYLLLIPE